MINKYVAFILTLTVLEGFLSSTIYIDPALIYIHAMQKVCYFSSKHLLKHNQRRIANV